MPHVKVQLWPGRTEEQKAKLAEAITRDLAEIMGSKESSVSVEIEEIESDDWKKKVYDPDIKEKLDQLYKKPGYSM